MEEIRIILGVQNKMSVRVDKCVPRWFGHVERMDDKKMATGYMIREYRGDDS